MVWMGSKLFIMGTHKVSACSSLVLKLCATFSALSRLRAAEHAAETGDA